MSTYSHVSVWQFEKKKDLTYIELIRQGGWIEGGCLTIFLRCTPFSFSGLYLQKIASFFNKILGGCLDGSDLCHPINK